MTMLFLIYIISCFGMIFPNIEFYKGQGYATIENVCWSILCLFTPVLNTILFTMHLVETIRISKIFNYKIWEKK